MDARSIRVLRRGDRAEGSPEPLPGARARGAGVRLAAVLLALPVAALAILVGTAVAVGAAYDGRILPNVSVAGVDLSGARPDEARTRLAEAIRVDAELTLVVGDREIRTSASDLGRTVDVDGAIAAAMALGRSGEASTDVATRLGLLTTPRGLDLGPVVDRAAIDAFVDRVAAEVDRPPIDPNVVRLADRWLATDAHPGHALDRAAAAAALAAALADPQLATTTVPLPVATIPSALTDAEAAAAIAAAERMVAPLALVLGDEAEWTFTTAQLLPGVRFLETPGMLVPTYDVARATFLVGRLRKEVAVAPAEASFLVTRDGRRFGYVGGRNGRELDVPATATAVLGSVLDRRVATAEAPPLAVATRVLEPDLTAAEAARSAPRMVRISTWTTRFVVSERNGLGANITIPARLINGTVVRPGATFDFWAAVGPVTFERGFRMGGIIQGGRTNPTGAIAGGICSASTTLFNAAIRAGLEIVEREAHFYYIDRYPLGLDATVSKTRGGTQNMRFRNDTPHPIFIRGTAGAGWVRFDLYAVRDERSVTFSRPQVTNVDRAGDGTASSASLRAGARERVEWPADGMNVVVIRTVRDADGDVVHVDRIATRYHRVDGLVLVGTG